MKPVVLALLALVVTTTALAGCGQKGDLYLPGHNPHPPKPLLKPADKHAQRSGNSPDRDLPESKPSNSKASQPSAADNSDNS